MRVAICDDNRQFLQAFQQQLKSTPNITSVHTFSAADDLFQYCEANKAFDVLFLDLALEEDRTGFQIAEALYRLAPNMSVVYVTGYTERFVQEVFLHKGNICGFLTKPVDPAMLTAHLQMIIQKRTQASAQLSFRTRDGIEAIPVDDILYLESNGHLLAAHTRDTVYHTYEKLSDVLKQLPDRFVQCHKSFAINLQFIQRFTSTEVVLKTGTAIPISRSRRTETKTAYFSYIGREM